MASSCVGSCLVQYFELNHALVNSGTSRRHWTFPAQNREWFRACHIDIRPLPNLSELTRTLPSLASQNDTQVNILCEHTWPLTWRGSICGQSARALPSSEQAGRCPLYPSPHSLIHIFRPGWGRGWGDVEKNRGGGRGERVLERESVCVSDFI